MRSVSDLECTLLGIGEKPGAHVAPGDQVDILKDLRGALAHFRQAVDVLPERITVAGRPNSQKLRLSFVSTGSTAA
jgi:hypothetical protein